MKQLFDRVDLLDCVLKHIHIEFSAEKFLGTRGYEVPLLLHLFKLFIGVQLSRQCVNEVEILKT